MNQTFVEMAGIAPAIIFPAATLLQLAAIIKAKSAKGVSKLTWTLFGIANICMYIFTEKYTSVQTIVGFLGTAVIDFIIVALLVINRPPGSAQ